MTPHAEQTAARDRLTTPVLAFQREVGGRLRGVARHLRLLVGARGMAIVLASAVLLALGQLVVDRWLRLARDMRAALLGAIVVGLAVVAWRRLIQPLRIRVGQRETALLLERRFPALRDRLISAVEFAAAPVENGDDRRSSEMIATLLSQASKQFGRLPLAQTFQYRQLVRSLATALVAVVVFGAGWAQSPETFSLWYRRNLLLQDVPWPQATHLIVEGLIDGALTHPRGDDLTVRVGVREGDRVPRIAEIEYAFDDGAGGTDAMSRMGGDRFVAAFPHVNDPLRFRVSAGDDQTDWIPVRLIDRPRVVSSRITVTPPAYTSLAPRELQPDATLIEALPGAVVRLQVETNVPLESATLVFAGEPVAEAERVSDTLFRADASPAASGAFHFDLLAGTGLRDNRPARFTVRMLEDLKPRVALRWPGVGELVTPAAVLPIELEASDEFGLATLALHVEVEPGAERKQDVPFDLFQPGTTRFEQVIELPVESFGVAAGDRVAMTAMATDFDDVSGPNAGESLTANFRVVTEAELLAEMARREQEYRHELEKLIRTQERIRADFLSWAAGAGDSAQGEEAAKTLARLERQERNVAVRAGSLEKQISQIVTECRINRVSETASRNRLSDSVVQPLTDVARRRIPEAADALVALRDGSASVEIAAVDESLAQIIDELRRVLAQMIKWEGYQEAVTLLRDILELQGEVSEETRSAAERQVRELFGVDQ